MKRGARSLAVILAVVMVIAMFPLSVSAASKPGKVKITKFKVGAVSAATNTTTVTIKWKRVKGATGYEVFEMDNQTGQWKRLKKLSWIYGGLRIRKESAGLRAFKVRAVKKKKKGAFSKTKSKFIASPLTLERLAQIEGSQTSYSQNGADILIQGNNATFTYELTKSSPSLDEATAFSDGMKNELSARTDAQKATYINLCRNARLDAGITGVRVIINYTYKGKLVVSKTYTE